MKLSHEQYVESLKRRAEKAEGEVEMLRAVMQRTVDNGTTMHAHPRTIRYAPTWMLENALKGEGFTG